MLTELEPKPYLFFGIINNEKYNEQVRLDIQGSLRMQNPEKLQKRVHSKRKMKEGR